MEKLLAQDLGAVVNGGLRMSVRLIRILPFGIGLAVTGLVTFLFWAQSTLPGFRLLQRAEWATYDWRVRKAADEGARATGGDIGLVVIDEESLQYLNRTAGYQWPLPRKVYGEAVRELAAQGVKGIAFDLFFIDRGANTPASSVVLQDGGTVGSDEFLASQLKSFGHAVLAAPPWPGKTGALVMPYGMFRSSGAQIGHAHAHLDGDGVLRRVLPFMDDPKNGRVWQLGLVLAAARLEADLSKAIVEPRRILLPRKDGKTTAIPLDEAGFMLVNWTCRLGDPRLMKQSLKTVLDQAAARATRPAQTWAGKLAIIGSAGAGNNIKDMGPTPISRNDHLVTAHWNIANSLLTGSFTREQPMWARLCLVVALSVVSGWASWRLRAFWASVVVLGLAAAYVTVVTWIFTRWRIWIPIVLPVSGALLMTHAAMVGYRSLIEGAHRRKVRSLFGRIVAPDVMDALVQLPGYPVEPIHREMSVFFADIRGFTAFTDQQHLFAQEQVEAQGLTGAEAKACVERHAAQALATVNEYLTAVVDAIKRNGGTLDKYIGDCVMAFWGAPLADPRHAANAIKAAIDAQRAVHALNAHRQRENETLGRDNRRRTNRGESPQPLLATLSLGVSVHSGPMTVGFMGSDRHLSNYTVFGREVNIASRLEHLVSSGCILATERSRDEAAAADKGLLPMFHERDAVTVKGVLQRLRIFEVFWKI